MGLKDFFVERITRKGVETICHPRGKLEGSVVATTAPDNYLNSYLVDREELEITESGGFVTSLPKKSNIRDLEPVIDDIVDEWGGYRGSKRGSGPKEGQVSWIDGFNRFAATRTETPDGISYVLRADLANEVSQRGRLLVQCDETFCSVLVPSKVSVNLNRFALDLER
jgi:hypothetical protein